MDKFTKLSQAIRVGAKIRPKCRFVLFAREHDQVRSCALGAAYEAMTGDVKERCYADVETLAITRFNIHPDTLSAIVHRNDALDWSREHIADWLEQQGL